MSNTLGIRTATFGRAVITNQGWDGGVGNTLVPANGDTFTLSVIYDSSAAAGNEYTYTYENVSTGGVRDFTISETFALTNWPSVGTDMLGGSALARGNSAVMTIASYEFQLALLPPASVPEPSTWALLIAGTFGVGLLTWRRRIRSAG